MQNVFTMIEDFSGVAVGDVVLKCFEGDDSELIAVEKVGPPIGGDPVWIRLTGQTHTCNRVCDFLDRDEGRMWHNTLPAFSYFKLEQ